MNRMSLRRSVKRIDAKKDGKLKSARCRPWRNRSTIVSAKSAGLGQSNVRFRQDLNLLVTTNLASGVSNCLEKQSQMAFAANYAEEYSGAVGPVKICSD